MRLTFFLNDVHHKPGHNANIQVADPGFSQKVSLAPLDPPLYTGNQTTYLVMQMLR